MKRDVAGKKRLPPDPDVPQPCESENAKGDRCKGEQTHLFGTSQDGQPRVYGFCEPCAKVILADLFPGWVALS